MCARWRIRPFRAAAARARWRCGCGGRSRRGRDRWPLGGRRGCGGGGWEVGAEGRPIVGSRRRGHCSRGAHDRWCVIPKGACDAFFKPSADRRIADDASCESADRLPRKKTMGQDREKNQNWEDGWNTLHCVDREEEDGACVGAFVRAYRGVCVPLVCVVVVCVCVCVCAPCGRADDGWKRRQGGCCGRKGRQTA